MLVTHHCNEWYVGTDPAGVAVLVDDRTGEVQSHGTVHSGQVTSAVPALTRPLAIAPVNP